MSNRAREQEADAGFWFTRSLDKRAVAAMEQLLCGIQHAAERDHTMPALELALEQGVIADGLRAFVMRAVFMFAAEARGLFCDTPSYESTLGVTALARGLKERSDAELQTGMTGYRRCTALWRAMHYGVRSPGILIWRGGGDFFNPEAYPFLEGRLPGEASLNYGPPSVPDVVMHNVLSVLLWFDNEGKPIDWLAFDPYYLGFIYEAMMGFDVIRLKGDAVRL